MGATSVTGTGKGSSEGLIKGPGNNRNIYEPLNGSHVVAAGEIYSDGYWQILVTVPGLTETPDKYAVIVTQSDFSNYDGHGYRPPHVEKIDVEGHNLDWWGYEYSSDNSAINEKYWELPMGGFILHTGSSNEHMFNYVIVRIGGGGNSTWDF
jgi:hypothetical protein